MSLWPHRIVGVLLALTCAWYLPWAVTHLDHTALPWSIAFIAATLLLVASLVLSTINGWNRASPAPALTRRGAEPVVAVIVPTAGEAIAQLDRTVRSVLEQDWPHDRLWLVVSDDAHRREVRLLVDELRWAHLGARIDYHEPPAQDSPDRRGAAKAGNLNSAVAFVEADGQPVAFVETRDADDLVVDPAFLSACVAALRADERLAYVQTIKEARVSPGDPFDNLQPSFFRGTMEARHAANAVFPCGSGLVWRLAAIHDIGGFPTWNLVEDLQSGVEALRRGWRGAYLPIVGAYGQHAPEDIAVFYKQRGTWALDTLRLLLWGEKSGLSLRQRLHFYELGTFYLQGLATMVFVLTPVVGLLTGAYPLEGDLADYVVHFLPFAAVLELQLAVLNRPNPYETLWRSRIVWVGLAPVYVRALALAVLGGRRRKPTYKVTRKRDEHRWYWRETSIQAVLLASLVVSLLAGVLTSPSWSDVDAGSLYWVVLYVVLLGAFVRRSWFGVPKPSWVAALGLRGPTVSGVLAGASGLALAALALMTRCGGSGCELSGPTSSAQVVVVLGAVSLALMLGASRAQRIGARARAVTGWNAAAVLAALSGLLVLAVPVT